MGNMVVNVSAYYHRLRIDKALEFWKSDNNKKKENKDKSKNNVRSASPGSKTDISWSRSRSASQYRKDACRKKAEKADHEDAIDWNRHWINETAQLAPETPKWRRFVHHVADCTQEDDTWPGLSVSIAVAWAEYSYPDYAHGRSKCVVDR